jgi:hypothetical protein
MKILPGFAPPSELPAILIILLAACWLFATVSGFSSAGATAASNKPHNETTAIHGKLYRAPPQGTAACAARSYGCV